MGTFYYLIRKGLKLELQLLTTTSNELSANQNAAFDADNTSFVYIINYLVHTIFQQINLCFNGSWISEQTDTCAYLVQSPRGRESASPTGMGQ